MTPAGVSRWAPYAGHLRDLRRARNLTQSQVAQLAGIREASLSRLEHGRGDPKVGTIVAVAAALGVRPGELLTEGAPVE